MTLRSICGAEANFLNELGTTTGGVSISALAARTGSYGIRTVSTTTGLAAFRINGSVAAAGAVLGGRSTTDSLATVISGFAFKVITAPAANDELIYRLQTGSFTPANKCEVRITSTGVLKLYDATPTLVATGTINVADGNWHYVEIKIGTGASAAYEIRVDGVTDISGTVSLPAIDTTLINFGKHINRNSNVVEFYFDDIYMDDSTFRATTTTFPQIKALIPDGAGNYAQWATGTGTTYTEVDDIPPDNGTTTIATITANQLHTFNLESATAKGITGTILALEAVMFFITGTSASITPVVRSGVTDALGPAQTGASRGGGYDSGFAIAPTNPATAAAWTLSELDSVEIGVKSTGSSAVNARTLTAIQGHVLYLDAYPTAAHNVPAAYHQRQQQGMAA